MTGRTGKRVRGSLYLHASALASLDEADREKVARAASLARDFVWNVARLDPGSIVGLLHYPDFDHDPFPALQSSARVDLDSGTVRRFRFEGSANPLILHRKELLVLHDHPQRSAWAALTSRLVGRGLFEDVAGIGRRRAWQARLERHGIAGQAARP